MALLYEFPSWREPPGWGTYVTVDALLAGVRGDLGSVPAALDTDLAVRSVASLIAAPLVDADIEGDLIFPCYRWASRAWVRSEWAKFHAWCVEQGILEAEKPRAKKAKKAPEPAAV